MLLGNVAYRAGGGFNWNAAQLRPNGNPRAEEFICPTFRRGWEVDAVRSVSDARELLESRGYSAVITDLRFSGPQSSDGMTIVKLAREHNPSAPVVVMTGYFSPEAEAEARRLGVDAFIPKPVPLWELARLVQGWAASQAVSS